VQSTVGHGSVFPDQIQSNLIHGWIKTMSNSDIEKVRWDNVVEPFLLITLFRCHRASGCQSPNLPNQGVHPKTT